MYIFLFFPDIKGKFFARSFLPRRNLDKKNCRRPDTRQGKTALRKAQEEGILQKRARDQKTREKSASRLHRIPLS